jgi:predicted HTH transcriptional regulator
MSRPNPRLLFDEPQAHWAYLTQPTDDGFEGQHFDRKEAGRLQAGGTISSSSLSGLKDLVVKTISAFANSNVEGGLLVLGISSSGDIAGIDHLTEDQKNSITNLNTLLRSHAGEVRDFDCRDSKGAERTICLIYTHGLPNAICETPEATPRAWVRNGSQSNPMNHEMGDQIRIRKGLLDTDNLACCPFSPDDVDADVLTEFRRVFHPDATRDFAVDRLLYEAGAVVRTNGGFAFTMPGLLFFASNPQRVFPHAYIRLMKFLVPSGEHRDLGTPSFDKDFRGPITKQIRAARTFFRESSFFERYQRRKPDGGFVEEHELPPTAVDEAIVNAVAHRDYHARLSIEVEHYTDALIVKNPGRVLQRNFDLPNRFSFGDTHLDSMPRNRRLLEWLRLMRDSDGKEFVQAISEGTKQMTREMVALSLPAPSVILLDNETLLSLETRAEERKAALKAGTHETLTEFTNLYPLKLRKASGTIGGSEFHLRMGEFAQSLKDSLRAKGWYLDRFSFDRITVHRTGVELPIAPVARPLIRFYPAYSIQIHEMHGKPYLSIDYTCQVLNIRRAHEVLRHLPASTLVKHRCVAQMGSWREGRIVTADSEWATVHFFDDEKDQRVRSDRVIPNLSLGEIEELLQGEKISFDLHGTVKKHSLAGQAGASRRRAEKIQVIAEQMASEVFPVALGDIEARLLPRAVPLTDKGPGTSTTFRVERLGEPAVEFRGHHAQPDVRDGITRFGSYDSDPHTIELVLNQASPQAF